MPFDILVGDISSGNHLGESGPLFVRARVVHMMHIAWSGALGKSAT